MKESKKGRKKRKNKERTKNRKNGAFCAFVFSFLAFACRLEFGLFSEKRGKGGKEGGPGRAVWQPQGRREGSALDERARRNRPRGTGSGKVGGLSGQQQQQREQGRGLHTQHVRPSSGPAQPCVSSPCETGRRFLFFPGVGAGRGISPPPPPSIHPPVRLRGARQGRAQHSTGRSAAHTRGPGPRCIHVFTCSCV